jgi:hypothetical protein
MHPRRLLKQEHFFQMLVFALPKYVLDSWLQPIGPRSFRVAVRQRARGLLVSRKFSEGSYQR